MTSPLLRIENLEKAYPDGTQALRGVSFSVDRGEFIVILGKSGSGKSTLLRCINRLVEPTRGTIWFDGENVTEAGRARLRAIRKKIGVIFQKFNLLDRVSVATNVLAGSLGSVSPWASLVNHFPSRLRERATQNLQRVGLESKSAQRARDLSGGQQQRVGIARALMQKPVLMLADEPVASLDPATSRTILETLVGINREDGVTVLCNLHSPELAREFASRIIALRQGALVFDGSPQELIPSEEIYPAD